MIITIMTITPVKKKCHISTRVFVLKGIPIKYRNIINYNYN